MSARASVAKRGLDAVIGIAEVCDDEEKVALFRKLLQIYPHHAVEASRRNTRDAVAMSAPPPTETLH